MTTHRNGWHCGGIMGLALAAAFASTTVAPAQTLRPQTKKDTTKDTAKKSTAKNDTGITPGKTVDGVTHVPMVKGIVKSTPAIWKGVIPGTNPGLYPGINPLPYSPLSPYGPSVYSTPFPQSYPYMTPMPYYQQYPQMPYNNSIYNMYPPNPYVNATPAFQPFNPVDPTMFNGLQNYYRPPVFPAVDGFGTFGGGLGYAGGFGF